MIEMTIAQRLAIWALPLIFAITLHEVAHGYVASLFGDQTAKLSGRLTLNPIRHIDLMGTIVLPLTLLLFSSPIIFGWAKPVPVDPRNLRHPRRDMALVALAGPFSNILMAIFWAALGKLGLMMALKGDTWIGYPLFLMGESGIVINVVLAVLNLILLPPLDGSKILSNILPRQISYYFYLIEPYSFIILLVLLFTGILSIVMMPAVLFLFSLITSLFGLK